MRIISGKYRGRKLVTVSDNSTRPTTDRVKESLFNILQFRISGSRVLDLFAGSGALGAECLSRGAERVVFADISPAAIKVIGRNIRGMEGNFEVMNSHFKRVLKNGGKYDIIFIDAPYRSGLGEEALRDIVNCNALSEGGIISFERAADEFYTLPDGLTRADSRRYGDTAIDFLTYENCGNNGKL